MKSTMTYLSWKSLFLISLLTAYLFVFNEWLFIVTKPSQVHGLPLPHQLQIFFTTAALLAGLFLVSLLPLPLLNRLPPAGRYKNTWIKIGLLLPAVVISTLILMMVDNFTYTIFKFGIVSTDGWSRGLFGLGFLVVTVVCYWRLLLTIERLSRRTRLLGLEQKWILSGLLVLLVLSLAVFGASIPAKASASLSADPAETARRPNILLITADGLNANNMSVYGYERDTTPRLRELVDSALVAENAFSNAGNSTGSIISMYTGKHPARTRVIYPPDILQSEDATEHLPGLLRAEGYRTVQITLPYYLDANELNVVDGFDQVFTSKAGHTRFLNRIRKYMPNENAMFVDEVIKRLIDRFRHIFFLRRMTNPYLLVTQINESLVDQERWENLVREVKTSQQPVFIHIHLMVTHGERFNPIEQKFSAGQSIADQESWSIDFYDDSILEFDKNVGSLVDQLAATGLLDRTLLIIGSDHGMQWDTLQRLPLILRFPHGQYAGRIQANVQNLDIAATVLDYLGLEKPGWISGQSLIAGSLEQRPIFSTMAADREENPEGGFKVNWDRVTAPFYQFKGITLVYCEKWYELKLITLEWKTGNVAESTAACSPDQQITGRQAFEWIVDHLKQNGFDVSTLENLSLVE